MKSLREIHFRQRLDEAIKTNNHKFGYHGTVKGKDDAEKAARYAAVAKDIIRATGEPNERKVRDYLDSPHGRLLADIHNDSGRFVSGKDDGKAKLGSSDSGGMDKSFGKSWAQFSKTYNPAMFESFRDDGYGDPINEANAFSDHPSDQYRTGGKPEVGHKVQVTHTMGKGHGKKGTVTEIRGDRVHVEHAAGYKGKYSAKELSRLKEEVEQIDEKRGIKESALNEMPVQTHPETVSPPGYGDRDYVNLYTDLHHAAKQHANNHESHFKGKKDIDPVVASMHQDLAAAHRKAVRGYAELAKYHMGKLHDKLDEETIDEMFDALCEQIELQELSKKTLGRYVNKAHRMAGQHVADNVDADHQGGDDYMEYRDRRIDNHKKGIERAVKRLTKEDVEQIDELSKKTLKSYMRKAGTSLDRANTKMDKEEDKAMSTDGNKYPEKQARHMANANAAHKTWLKRDIGLSLANRALLRAKKKAK